MIIGGNSNRDIDGGGGGDIICEIQGHCVIDNSSFLGCDAVSLCL